MPGEESVMLARVYELRAQVAAVEAEIEGMKTANKICNMQLNCAPAYEASDFNYASIRLQDLANALHQIGYF